MNRWSHDEQVSHQRRIGIPVGMGRAAGHQDCGARGGLDGSVAYLYTELAFEHIPGFVIVVVKVQGRYPARGAGRSACIFPLGDHKRIFRRADRVAGKKGSNRGGTHREEKNSGRLVDSTSRALFQLATVVFFSESANQRKVRFPQAIQEDNSGEACSRLGSRESRSSRQAPVTMALSA